MDRTDAATPPRSIPPGEYQVVARRYRPQTFDQLLGQEHVGQALAGAITSQKVGHAYLFTGARGVGKTSAARILAKALNCVQGPTPTPCNQCDICRAVSTGDDVDVLEIDGASNRGIDEMRELRQNVNVRPSRSRFKIYIIDEVHMLTKEAFNALLKTLEEPPEHVKFIFCTTEPEKIPITVLSRCQRFDFAGIHTAAIAERLAQIVAAEGIEAQPEALAALARRAAGSMRDSQSLLEQLLSFGGQRITVEDVHRMLGTAGDRRLSQLAARLVDKDAAAALNELNQALAEGVDVGPLLDQLLGYFRDMMVASVGGSPDSLLYAAPSEQEAIMAAGRGLGLETVLAIMQILDQTLARLRYSSHARILAELAVVRICALENLDQLADAISTLRDGSPAPAAAARAGGSKTAATGSSSGKTTGAAAKKKFEPLAERPLAAGQTASSPPSEPAPKVEQALGQQVLNAETVATVWQQVLQQLSDLLREQVSFSRRIAIGAPNRLVVSFPEQYTSCKSFCERPEQVARLREALRSLTGQEVRVEFALLDDEPAVGGSSGAPKRFATAAQLLRDKSDNPLVRQAIELFEARPVRLEEAES